MASVLQEFNAIGNILDKRVVLQMDDQIYLDRPDDWPILAFLAKVSQTRSVENMEYWWLEDTLRPPALPLTVDYTPPVVKTDDHTFVFADGVAPWLADPGTIIFASWGGGQQFKVKTVTENAGVSTTITAALWPSDQTNAIAALAGSNVILSYPVKGDLEDAPMGNFLESVPKFNYCEQFMRAVTLSDILNQTKMYGGDLRRMEHDKQLKMFLTDQEAAAVYGIRAKDDSGKANQNIGTIWRTGGFRNDIKTNVFDFSGNAIDFAGFLSKLPLVTEFSNPSELALIVPAMFKNKVTGWAMDKLYLDQKDDRFGRPVTKLVTGWGDFPLVHSRMLDKWSKPELFLLNLKTMRRVTFTGTDGMVGAPRLYMNAQLTSQPNKILDFYRGIGGLELKQEVKSAKFVNFI